MNRFSFTLFLCFFAIFSNEFCFFGAAKNVERKAVVNKTETSTEKISSNQNAPAAGVIVSKSDEAGENVLSASVSGLGAAVMSGSVGEDGIITGTAISATDGHPGEASGAVLGTGVISMSTGNGTSFAVKGNGTVYTFSTSNGESDESIGISSSGDGVVEIKTQPGAKQRTNVAALQKGKKASASASGSITSTSVSSEEGSASGTSTSGEGTASGSSSESGSASAILFSKGKKTQGGTASSGSSSGGKASTSVSASEDPEDESDDGELSSSVSAISSRHLPSTIRFRRYASP